MPDQDVRLESPENCRVYVLRTDRRSSSQFSVEVLVGGELIGAVGAGHYVCWEGTERRRVLQVRYKRPDYDREPGMAETVVDLNLAPGTVRFWMIDVTATGSRPTITELSEDAGRAVVADSKASEYDPAWGLPR